MRAQHPTVLGHAGCDYTRLGCADEDLETRLNHARHCTNMTPRPATQLPHRSAWLPAELAHHRQSADRTRWAPARTSARCQQAAGPPTGSDCGCPTLLECHQSGCFGTSPRTWCCCLTGWQSWEAMFLQVQHIIQVSGRIFSQLHPVTGSILIISRCLRTTGGLMLDDGVLHAANLAQWAAHDLIT